jgi:hypothetical protein
MYVFIAKDARESYAAMDRRKTLPCPRALAGCMSNNLGTTPRMVDNFNSAAHYFLDPTFQPELTLSDVWESLLENVFRLAGSEDALHRESAFQIIANLPSLITGQPRNVVVQAFSVGLKDAAKDVRLAALTATTRYIIDTDAEDRTGFDQLIPLMLNVLPDLVASGDSQALADALGDLVDLAGESPKLFRPVFSQLVEFLTSVIKNEDLEEQATRMAMELLVTIAESAPGMVRKHPNFVNLVLPIILGLIGQLEDDDDWLNADDEDEDDETSILGQQAMDRLAMSLGGKFILPLAFNYIPAMMSSQDWHDRYAALMGLSAMAEGCAKLMEAELAKVLQLIFPMLKDVNGRVRYAACHALGQLCNDFAVRFLNVRLILVAKDST